MSYIAQPRYKTGELTAGHIKLCQVKVNKLAVVNFGEMTTFLP